MHIRIRLLLMQALERRNAERIEAYKKAHRPPVQLRKKKAKRNKGKSKK